MKYSQLKSKNPEYKKDLYERMELLYEGGFELLERAHCFLPKQIGETIDRYRERIKNASYIPHFGHIVDQIAGNLFAADLRVDTPAAEPEDFYNAFAFDANLRGDDFASVMKSCFRDALVYGKSVLACDFPRVEGFEASSLLEEDALGLARAYCYTVEPEDLLDWETDSVRHETATVAGGKVTWSVGKMRWCTIYRKICDRASPSADRSSFVEEFVVWEMANGRAQYTVYRTAPRTEREQDPRPEDEVPVFASGVTSFKEIPVLQLELPEGLWLGNKIGPLAVEHFRRRSALIAAENRSLFAVPLVKLGPEIPAVDGQMPSDVQTDPNRGEDPIGAFTRAGYVVLGKDDDLKFVEPSGDAYKIIDEQLDKLVDEMYRVCSLMGQSVSSSSSAVGRSGASKQLDKSATNIVLSAYAAIVKDFAARVYSVIAAARGEDFEWSASGLDKFNEVDRVALIEEAKSLSQVPIESQTFKAEWQTAIAKHLLNDPGEQVLATIREEILAGVEQAEQDKKAGTRVPSAN